jgi:hypothetical protein
MADSLELLESELKKADIGRYISALFKAEETFRKELAEYGKDKVPEKNRDIATTVSSVVSGTFFKQLPLKYRVAMKLPWNYLVDIMSGFLKELGDGSAEDVVTGLAKAYIDSLANQDR